MTALDLGQEEVREEQYAADLELLDRYTGFSSELVRLASLGLGGLAVFLKSSAPKGDLEHGWFDLLLGGSAFLFSIGIAFGLLHRFYAADGFACHIRALRLAKQGSSGVEAEAMARRNRYKLANSWLISSECAVAAGAFVAGMALAVKFSIMGDKEKVALPLAGLVVLCAAGVAGFRWWRAWRAIRHLGRPTQGLKQTPDDAA